jgi:HEPN domain-containing protein
VFLSQADLEEAQLLLRKAREDADAVKKLTPEADIADSIVGFHAQQAVEKALKAVLAVSGDDFPWTHDLRYLMDRLETIETPLPAALREVHTLGPWAVEFRYGQTINDLLEREQALALANEVIEWAQAEIEGPAHTQQVTAGDLAAGVVRVPSRSKPLFPSERALMTVALRGAFLHDVRWDPRLGPDRERSGVLRIGKDAASQFIEGERLGIARIEDGVRLD